MTNNTPGNRLELSPEGQQRRDAMLLELQSEMTRIQRQRFQRKAGLTAAAILIVAGVAWANLIGPLTDGRDNRIVDSNPPSENNSAIVATTTEPLLKVCHNRVDIVGKYNVSRELPSNVAIEVIDDLQLQELLAQNGSPSVVGRIGGKVTVVPIKSL